MKLLTLDFICLPLMSAQPSKNFRDEACLVEYLKSKSLNSNEIASDMTISDENCETVIENKKKENLKKILEEIETSKQAGMDKDCVRIMIKFDEEFDDDLLFASIKMKKLEEPNHKIFTQTIQNFDRYCRVSSKYQNLFFIIIEGPNRSLEGEYCQLKIAQEEKLLPDTFKTNKHNLNTTSINCDTFTDSWKKQIEEIFIATLSRNREDETKLNCASKKIQLTNLKDVVHEFGLYIGFSFDGKVLKEKREKLIKALKKAQRIAITGCDF